MKYCKVLRLPEVSKSTLFPSFLSAAAEEVRKLDLEQKEQFGVVSKSCI